MLQRLSMWTIPTEFSESIPYDQKVNFLADAIKKLQEQIVIQNECILDLNERVTALENSQNNT